MLCLKHIRMTKKPVFECFTHKRKFLLRFLHTNLKKYKEQIKQITVKLVANRFV